MADSYIIQAGKDHELIETRNKAAFDVLGRKINLEAERVGLGSIQAMNNTDPSDSLTNLRRLEAQKIKESEVVRTNEYNQIVKAWMERKR